MPALAVYIGLHDITGLVYKSPDEVFYHSFPYIYTRELFSNFVSESDFYKAVFDSFCKDDGVRLSDCDILATGFLEPPALDFDLKMYKSLYEVIQGIENYFPILVNNYAVLTPRQIFCHCEIPDGIRAVRNPDEENFYANLSVYSQMVISDIVSRIDMDSGLLKTLPKEGISLAPGIPVVFMGSRFNRLHNIQEINHLLMLDILKAGGVYTLYTDPGNTILLTRLLSVYYGKSVNVKEAPEKIGTLISKRNAVECMVSNQLGVSQIVDLEKDKIFILPLDSKDTVKIMVKSPGENSSEYVAEGGSLGLIFDTREQKGDISIDFKTFNESIKSLSGPMGN